MDKRLAAFERKALKRLSGGIKENENLRKRYCKEIMQLLRGSDILSFSVYQPTNAFNKIQSNTNHKIQLMISIYPYMFRHWSAIFWESSILNIRKRAVPATESTFSCQVVTVSRLTWIGHEWLKKVRYLIIVPNKVD